MTESNNSTFDSQFNMAIAKLNRIHNSLSLAHESALQDDHKTWKLSLDGIYREIWPYLTDEKNKRNEIQDIKEKCTKELLEYFKWLSHKMRTADYEWQKQHKELNLEADLDEYERRLIQGMKELNMDMRGHDDVSRITMQARY